MKQKIGFYLVILIGLCLMSCEKDIVPIRNTISESDYDYIGFKPGTYWIYEDDSTLVVDSFSVNNLRFGQGERRNKHGDLTEYYDFVTCFLKRNGMNDWDYEFYLSEEVGSYYFGDWNISFKFENNVMVPMNSSQTINYYSVLMMDTSLYYDVYQITNQYWGDKEKIEVFTAQRIGIIKYFIKYNDGHTENKKLIRYYREP